MSEEEFQCKSEIIPSTVGPNPEENTGTVAIVSSVVGAMIVVLIFVAAVASCYFRRNKGQRKWFYARNQLIMPNDGLGAKTDDDDKEFEFDAFISFNEQDRSWVYTHLVPQLESSDPSDSGGIFVTISKIFHMACVLIFSFLDCAVKPFRLCIHDRDFTVGQRITENIIENIAKSRKVCLATNTASLRRIKFVMVCLCVFVGDYCSISWLRRKQMVSVRAAFIAAPFARVRAT